MGPWRWPDSAGRRPGHAGRALRAGRPGCSGLPPAAAQPRCSDKHLLGRGELAALTITEAEVVIDLGVLGMELDGLLIGGDGLLGIPLLVVEPSQTQNGIHILG